MFRTIVAAVTFAAFAFVCGEASAQRVIEYNAEYLPPLPETNIAYFDNAAVIVMSEADANLVTLEPEAHMRFTLRQHRIQMPIGAIVQNIARETYGELFRGGVSLSSDAASVPEGATIITIDSIRSGYDYRQIDERRPARPGEFAAPSTPSAEIVVRIVFSNADGVLYDSHYPPFAEAEDCQPDNLCIGTRIILSRRRGPVQSGFGNSKEVINRALHEVIQHALLIASCEFDADTRARARGARLTEDEALICRYPGYELVSRPGQN